MTVTPGLSTITLLAGSVGGAGHVDGTGAAARFAAPSSIALDTAGNAFVLDPQNATVRKVTPAGVVTIVAGTAGVHGTQDGDTGSARLNFPAAIAVDKAGTMAIVDGAAIRRITAAGAVTTVAGIVDQPGAVDGTGTGARFDGPTGIAFDASGVMYVADHNAMIRKVTPAGVVTTVAGKAYDYGVVDGAATTTARFFAPQGIAVDVGGNIYVSDADVSRVNVIRKISPAGVVSTLAGSASPGAWSDGTGAGARFNAPYGIAVDSTGTVYVADSGNQVIRAISSAGVVTTIAGKANVIGAVDGAAAEARFDKPSGIAVDANGNVLIADSDNDTIRKLTSAGAVSTLAGMPAGGGALDGTGAAAGMLLPQQIALDSAGNAYVADVGNGTIRKITPAGAVTTLAGLAGTFGHTDGTGADARFFSVTGLAVDNAGNVYVADLRNCATLCSSPSTLNTIRKITPAGVVTTLAGGDGQGAAQFSDGTGTAARFYLPSGLATDGSGNVYVADCGNGALRKITPDGTVTTLVRSGVCKANALTNLVSPTPPSGLVRDSTGNFFLSDGGAHAIVKISAAGAVSILAGSDASLPGFTDGTGTGARFDVPSALAMDATGNMYVADTINNAIRMVTPGGVVTTIAGKSGVSGVTLGNLPGTLSAPQGVAVDSHGALLVTTANGIVRIQ